MTNDITYQAFHSLAEKELAACISVVPPDPNERFVLFMETLRVIDYWTVFQSLGPEEKRLSEPDFHTLRSGWNLAAAHLLSPLQVPAAIPVLQSTDKSRSFAMSLLHQFGRSVLMHRAADMIRHGFLTAERVANRFVVRKTGLVSSQFLDILEFSWLENLETTIGQDRRSYYKEWELFDVEHMDQIRHRVGSFLGRRHEPTFENWRRADIEALMVPLIHPWDSGHGIMMGYGARPEVDDHFLAEAVERASDWRTEAGIHPDARIGETTGADATAIATLIVGFHLKHVRFAILASKHYPQISIPQSLTIWGPVQLLEESIAEYTGWDIPREQRALDAITLRAREATFLHHHSMPFMPLLISLENGLILRPVSGLVRNPLFSVSALVEWRNPKSTSDLSDPREDWLRFEIYALFQGVRYVCVEGSTKIRERDKVITDIDGAVFDKATGELGLFQIKWQDYFTNDVRKLRSKASNLTRELDEWAQHISEWTGRQGARRILSALRLSPKKAGRITNIYLFAISRNAARMQGFGFSTRHANLALANWPQFVRVRFEVGPADRVFHDIHTMLRSEADKKIEVQPLPVEITVAGQPVRFEDLWSSFD